MREEERSRARGTGVCVLALHESGWQQQARGCVNKAGVLVRLREVGWRGREAAATMLGSGGVGVGGARRRSNNRVAV